MMEIKNRKKVEKEQKGKLLSTLLNFINTANLKQAAISQKNRNTKLRSAVRRQTRRFRYRPESYFHSFKSRVS